MYECTFVINIFIIIVLSSKQGFSEVVKITNYRSTMEVCGKPPRILSGIVEQ